MDSQITDYSVIPENQDIILDKINAVLTNYSYDTPARISILADYKTKYTGMLNHARQEYAMFLRSIAESDFTEQQKLLQIKKSREDEIRELQSTLIKITNLHTFELAELDFNLEKNYYETISAVDPKLSEQLKEKKTELKKLKAQLNSLSN